MKSIFDKYVNRRNTGSMKWDVSEGELPMWVADMDFETAPEIKEAIIRRAEQGVFGYTLIEDEWYQAYQDWWESRHGFRIISGNPRQFITEMKAQECAYLHNAIV